MDEITQVPQHPGWTLNFDLSVEELTRFTNVVSKTFRTGVISFALIAISAWFSVVCVNKFYKTPEDLADPFFGYVFGTCIIYVVLARFYRKAYYRNVWPENSPILAAREMTFSDGGVFINDQYTSSLIRWPAIKNMIYDERHCIYWLVLTLVISSPIVRYLPT